VAKKAKEITIARKTQSRGGNLEKDAYHQMSGERTSCGIPLSKEKNL